MTARLRPGASPGHPRAPWNTGIQDWIPAQESPDPKETPQERVRRRRKERKAREEEEAKNKPKKNRTWDALYKLFLRMQDDLLLIVVASVAAFVKAMGITVESGHTGLRFSFGRARDELAPGFHWLVPFFQQARTIPTRSRTLDLPAQRVVAQKGLVYHADANLVYRVVDVRRALIQIDDLERGMLQMLGLGVQEVLREQGREDLRNQESLDAALAANLGQRLEPWGVAVERAGFPSITPSPQSLRITQLREVTLERQRTYERLCDEGVHRRRALVLIGARTMPRPASVYTTRHERYRRRVARIEGRLRRIGWKPADIYKARVWLHSRRSAGGSLRVR